MKQNTHLDIIKIIILFVFIFLPFLHNCWTKSIDGTEPEVWVGK